MSSSCLHFAAYSVDLPPFSYRWGERKKRPEDYFQRRRFTPKPHSHDDDDDDSCDGSGGKSAAVAQAIEQLRAEGKADDGAAAGENEKMVTYCNAVSGVIGDLFSLVDNGDAPPSGLHEGQGNDLPSSPVSKCTVEEGKLKHDELRNNPKPPEPKPQVRQSTGATEAPGYDDISTERPLNTEQAVVFEQMKQACIDFLNWNAAGSRDQRPKPRLHLCLGGPGSGKSEVIKQAKKDAEARGATVLVMAPMASAANVVGGATIHKASGLGMRRKRQNNSCAETTPAEDKRLSALRISNHVDTLAYLVIDEISAVDPSLLFQCDVRFRKMLGCDHKPFGGLSVFLFGDFFQLPPPGARGGSLVDVVIKTYVYLDADKMSETHRVAADLFRQFTITNLTQNMRAKDDEDWAGLIAALRTSVIGDCPVRDHLLPRLRRMTLTKEDVQSDPLWLEAPVCVNGNKVRTSIIRSRAEGIAHYLGVPVVRWRLRLSGAVAEHLTAGQLESLYENDPRLWGYFIQGQTAFLSENVQPERRVSNGTEVVFDSLILGGESSEMEAREDEDGDIEHGRFYEQVIADAKPGSVVTIHRPPFAVNVRLPGRTPCEFSDCNVDSTGNGVVVPITEMKKTTQLTCFLPGVGKLPGITVNSHGVEPSSSATCYKAQGRTMPRVLADLGNPPDKQPWTFEALFVFLSRVR